MVWPPIETLKNYEGSMRIDFIETIHGNEITEEDDEYDQVQTNERTGEKYYTTSYFMKYI